MFKYQRLPILVKKFLVEKLKKFKKKLQKLKKKLQNQYCDFISENHQNLKNRHNPLFTMDKIRYLFRLGFRKQLFRLRNIQSSWI